MEETILDTLHKISKIGIITFGAISCLNAFWLIRVLKVPVFDVDTVVKNADKMINHRVKVFGAADGELVSVRFIQSFTTDQKVVYSSYSEEFKSLPKRVNIKSKIVRIT